MVALSAAAAVALDIMVAAVAAPAETGAVAAVAVVAAVPLLEVMGRSSLLLRAALVVKASRPAARRVLRVVVVALTSLAALVVWAIPSPGMLALPALLPVVALAPAAQVPVLSGLMAVAVADWAMPVVAVVSGTRRLVQTAVTVPITLAPLGAVPVPEALAPAAATTVAVVVVLRARVQVVLLAVPLPAAPAPPVAPVVPAVCLRATIMAASAELAQAAVALAAGRAVAVVAVGRLLSPIKQCHVLVLPARLLMADGLRGARVPAVYRLGPAPTLLQMRVERLASVPAHGPV